MLQIVDYAADAFFEQWKAEVDHQTKSRIGKPKVGKQLSFKNGIVLCGCLEFYDDLIGNYQIDNQLVIELNTLVNDRNSNLLLS